MRLASSDIWPARPPADAASRSARCRVRLATTSAAGPALATLATASPLIVPAPTTRTFFPANAAGGSSDPKVNRSSLQPDGEQARACLADGGLGVRALPGSQRHRAKFGERAAQCALLPGQPQGLPELAEYLALADHHGVEAAGDRQQVLHRAVLVVHIQVRRQLALRHLRVPGQQLADRRYRAVELADLGINLDPVAGAQHQGSGNVLRPEHIVQQLAQSVASQRDPLERRQRRALVTESDDQNAHVPTACTPVL